MSRIVVFTDSGFILWDHTLSGNAEVSDSVLRKFITSALIEGNAGDRSPALVDGHDVYFAQDSVSRSTVAAISSQLTAARQYGQLVKDILKIIKAVNGAEQPVGQDFDIERFEQLALLALKKLSDSSSRAQSDANADVDEVAETETQSKNQDSEDANPAQDDSISKQSTKKPTKSRAASSKDAKKTKPKKAMRKWDGLDNEEYDGEELDFSENIDTSQIDELTAATDKLSVADYGSRTRHGFEVPALSDELDDILNKPSKLADAQSSNFGFLKSFMGGKTLTEKDLQGSINAMEQHLMSKNVAQEVAAHLTNKVREALLGSRTRTWTSVQAMVRHTMTETLQSILTPKTSVDLLLEIRKNRKTSKRPYVISVVGVNGVGKSTNLGKLGFWLLQNDFKVLVAACDTFRSGAVEQLKVHVDRLSQLSKQGGSGSVELFSQGYGKDAAVIAQKAVEFGEKNEFDIVLIDTAGRRHNDERLMSSLEKFGKLANPDKIIMVGEALVGTDSVQQARNFDAAFGPKRHLDFFLVSKVDTVGDMLGTIVNMTYSTGVPVLFVGVGQTYTDLRTLKVDWAVTKLLS